MNKNTHTKSTQRFCGFIITKCGWFGKNIKFSDKPTCKNCLRIMDKEKGK